MRHWPRVEMRRQLPQSFANGLWPQENPQAGSALHGLVRRRRVRRTPSGSAARSRSARRWFCALGWSVPDFRTEACQPPWRLETAGKPTCLGRAKRQQAAHSKRFATSEAPCGHGGTRSTASLGPSETGPSKGECRWCIHEESNRRCDGKRRAQQEASFACRGQAGGEKGEVF